MENTVDKREKGKLGQPHLLGDQRRLSKDKFKFPGGGTQFIHRADEYLHHISKDVHENQIQFALERGVPAMVTAFATRRLLYPSQAFDLIHCSRCRIDWTRDDFHGLQVSFTQSATSVIVGSQLGSVDSK
ncbi:hypothetical protein TSUD_254730 [Trifolium subterraneum]|uniref:Methyltransferase n=1 Tax=Trifolium subterraneum TaxID=3900 RepID=A0A2Z6P2N8_TRISU|nr:hypothetical protein TSUD_254730 [Trifolium subterraneum]